MEKYKKVNMLINSILTFRYVDKNGDALKKPFSYNFMISSSKVSLFLALFRMFVL